MLHRGFQLRVLPLEGLVRRIVHDLIRLKARALDQPLALGSVNPHLRGGAHAVVDQPAPGERVIDRGGGLCPGRAERRTGAIESIEPVTTLLLGRADPIEFLEEAGEAQGLFGVSGLPQSGDIGTRKGLSETFPPEIGWNAVVQGFEVQPGRRGGSVRG